MSFSPPGRPERMDPVRALPVLTVDASRSAPALRLPPQLHRGRPKKTERPHPVTRVTRSTIMSPGISPSTEISLGARAHGSLPVAQEVMPPP